MSEKYGEDQPWHLTQEPDESPSYEELEDSIEALNKELSAANKRGDAWRFRADIAEAKLAKAMEGLWKLNALSGSVETFDIVVHEIVHDTLAEIENSEAVTLGEQP
jgi:hypothetical protein